MKPRVNPGGPPPKAKYSCTTDSEPVGRLNVEKYRDERSQKYLNPYTYKQWEAGSRKGGLTAYLLHNGPTSYRARQA